MPQLNKEKLDQMKQAVITALGYLTPQQRTSLEIELSPFAMEMTDEEIEKECDKQSALITDADESIGWDNAFMMGANFVKYGK